MAEQHHEHGTMDITVQEKTFNGFMTAVTRTAIVIVVLLILLALVNA
ncbi:aa3-type cytochrome c oxidase subunit IV [Wenxinia marina]|uniref:Bacterial aa3 type cytochrome c oxidase subunit IV n=1 Tax=Wenxinia marina DSM 24838 TaxID=1123501 RepID=A0A0D0PG63_9RHOB|nr:aa3-type cytochrome c oxidase subunit IV [Wenxinia marina]KIQ70336.1 Bacterial aa3 type cytochrome c oxidase subunit IV [Wenxinia marina DSM 24838]